MRRSYLKGGMSAFAVWVFARSKHQVASWKKLYNYELWTAKYMGGHSHLFYSSLL